MASVLHRVSAGMLVLGGFAFAAESVRAQDAAAEPAAQPAAQPAAPAADQPAASKPQSPLVVEPKTPQDLFDAVVLMVDIARVDVARLYLEKFMETEPTDELLLSLRDKYGPAVFLKLSKIKELQPLSLRLLELNNAAFTRFARDPARLEALLKDLVSGTVAERAAAQQQMQTAGVNVVPALISALNNPQYLQAQSVLVETLALIKDEAVPPLEAALISPNPIVRQASMQALGIIGNDDAIPHLLRYAGRPAQSEDKASASRAIAMILRMPSIPVSQTSNVASRLLQIARDNYLGKIQYPAAGDGLVSSWYWNDGAGTVQERRLTPAEKALHEGLYFSRAALEVAPDRVDVQTTYLTLLLAQEQVLTGLGRAINIGPGTIHDLASSLGADAVNRALADALEMRKTEPALAALQVLAKVGTVQQVRVVTGKQSAMQRALNAPSRRVQFAAAQTIITLDPPTKYPGADRVVAILGRALTQAESSQARGLILDSVIERGQTLAGFLRDLGYDATLSRTGTEGFRIASAGQEVDLILTDANIQRWGLSETLANFKADPRTMDLPIVIFGNSTNARNVRLQVQQHRNVVFIEEPTASEDLREQTARFLAAQTEPPLTPEERSGKAILAADLLAFLSAGQRKHLYDFTPIEPQLLTAVENTQLAVRLLPVVGALPNPAAQTKIASMATDSGLPNEIRIAAMRQLGLHIRQYGLLIPDAQVKLLHQSAQQEINPGLFSELSAVLGILKPDPSLTGRRLLNALINQAPTPEPANQ